MSDAASSTVKLAVALAAAWLVLVVPAWLVGGAAAIVGLSLATWLCFVPHLLVVALGLVLPLRDRSVSGVLVAMAVRLGVVLVGALVICLYRPEFRGATFLVWLAPCYFVALAVETRFMIDRVGGSSGGSVVGRSSVTGTTIGS